MITEILVVNPHKMNLVEKVPIWYNGEFVPKDIIKFTLSLDHRVIDGAIGARFLQDLEDFLEGENIHQLFQ